MTVVSTRHIKRRRSPCSAAFSHAAFGVMSCWHDIFPHRQHHRRFSTTAQSRSHIINAHHGRRCSGSSKARRTLVLGCECVGRQHDSALCQTHDRRFNTTHQAPPFPVFGGVFACSIWLAVVSARHISAQARSSSCQHDIIYRPASIMIVVLTRHVRHVARHQAPWPC